MADRTELKRENKEEMETALRDARSALHQAAFAQAGVQAIQPANAQAQQPTSAPGIDVGSIPIYLSCTNPGGPAPYSYMTFEDAALQETFKPDPITGSASATAPATKGLGAWNLESPTRASPEVIQLFEEVTPAEKTLEDLIAESTVYSEQTLTFVLEDRIITLDVLVKNFDETTNTQEEWISDGGVAGGRKLLQVMPYGNANAGKLRIDLGYLKAP